MCINKLHKWLNNVDQGFDPLTKEYAQLYGEERWKQLDQYKDLINWIDVQCEGLNSKNVLDLGAGPGHLSYLMARGGAKVSYYDISQNYIDFAKEKLKKEKNIITFYKGYLDDVALKVAPKKFDLVVCNVAFYYASNDKLFAQSIEKITAENGMAFVCTHLPEFQRQEASLIQRARSLLYRYFNIKIGHPYVSLSQFCAFFSQTSFNDFSYFINEQETIVTGIFRKNSQRCPNIF